MYNKWMSDCKQLDPKDKKKFETRSSFPGAEGNPFDKILRALQKINQVPTILFMLLLFLFGGMFTLFFVKNWFILMIFALGDALLIALLPGFKISFGPLKSQVFLLFILRAFFINLPFPINLVFQLIGTILVIYGFLIEPSKIKINTIHHHFPNISSGLKFLHLSDIHLENIGVREYKLLTIVEERKPEFILYTGDFLNLSNIRNQKSIENVIEFFNKLHALSPIYYVSGSPAVDVEDTMKIIEKNLEPKRLKNSSELIRHNNNEINLIGITCTHQPHQDITNLPPLVQNNSLNILLYHSPDLVYELKPEHQVNLMLSGHTHGGQVRFPIHGAIFTGSLYGRKLQQGLYRIYDTLLYISRGIGLEGMGAPRVRFLCSPEIIEWIINDKNFQEEK